MKSPLFLLALLLLVSTACDSQKTTANATTEDSQAVSAMKGNPEPVAGVTIEELDKKYPDKKKAYLAGGCFWCTEASLDRIQGVADVYSGYAGGAEKNPTYYEVAGGKTGHAEAIVVYYDPAVITYAEILDVFFIAHDPTQLNRQGPDRGPQYRSAIFPLDAEQKRIAREKIAALDASGKFSSKVVTTIEAA
ncbi:MAG: peptide-methionine (S)-S-oxide reductase MsrA, partial [Bacteroidota bacterium]